VRSLAGPLLARPGRPVAPDPARAGRVKGAEPVRSANLDVAGAGPGSSRVAHLQLLGHTSALRSGQCSVRVGNRSGRVSSAA
jgi:hypothetical protein